jgi:hypothetical protein
MSYFLGLFPRFLWFRLPFLSRSRVLAFRRDHRITVVDPVVEEFSRPQGSVPSPQPEDVTDVVTRHLYELEQVEQRFRALNPLADSLVDWERAWTIALV